MKTLIASLILALSFVVSPHLATPAVAQPCQWRYSMEPANPDNPNAGTATATYCGDVNVAGSINLNIGPNTVATINLLPTLPFYTAGSTFYVQGYNAPGDGGGGTFLLTASAAANDNCVTFPGPTGLKWIRQLNGASLAVEMCGAYNDGTHPTETHAAFQAANDYVAASGNPSATITAYGYRYNIGSGATGIVKAESPACPTWIGAGNNTNGSGTIIQYTPSVESATFVFIGGSGSLCGGGIKNIAFRGNANTIAVEVRGQGGMNFDIVAADTLKRLVLLHNDAPNKFSEFNRLTLHSAVTSLASVLEYRVSGGGNASFHGSGIVGGTLNWSNSNPAIIIGAGAFPYNAPLEATFFLAASTTLIQNNYTGSGFGEAWFYGNITTEQGDGSFVLTYASTNQLLFAGNVMNLGNNNKVSFGTLYRVSAVSSYGNSQRSTVFLPINRQSLTTGATSNLLSYQLNGDWNNYIINVKVTGANYNAFVTAYLLFTEGSGYTIANVVNTVVTNTAGYGNVVLSAIPGGLNVSSSGTSYPAGLTVVSTLTQIGQGSDHHMKQ